MSDPVSWFHVPRPVARPRARLLCFPHAGGSGTLFHPWPPLLDADVEVVAVQLPGRATRRQERPYRRMVHLIPALVEVVRPRLDIPYVIFGHSLGAVVGFELVRALRRAGATLPASLFVSGRVAPQLDRDTRPIHHLPQAAFLRALEDRYGVADRTLRDPEMAAMLYPSLQADMEILETWTYAPDEPLAVPITASGGLRDHLAPRDALDAWREQTVASFALHLFAGDHFYLVNDRAPLLGLVRAALEGVGRGAVTPQASPGE